MNWRPVYPLGLGLILLGMTALPGWAQQPDSRPWPFHPPRDAPPPQTNSDWVRNGIDAFILPRLRQEGLKPAPEAKKRHLIRRLTFDLIGLPPSPQEVEAFLADESDAAYERLVDHLLKDPRYGERWARYWLDLARYADTAGYEGDPDLPHAWRYRDYVIDALNNDKPYDLFIKEQIAGDEFHEVLGAGELPAVSPEHVVALTFLRLAPFTEPRGDESRHEMLSEMTSTVSSVFLGLTVGCAKCHDHKYDEIPTEDFYRLKAFFATVAIPPPARGDGFQIGGSIPAKFYRHGEETWAAKKREEIHSEMEASQEMLAEFREELRERLGSGAGFGLQAMGGPLGNNYIYGRTTAHDNKLHVSVANCNGKQWTFFADNVPATKTGSNAGSNQGQWFGDIPNIKHVSLGQYSEGTGTIKTADAHHVGEIAHVILFDHPLAEPERDQLHHWLSASTTDRAALSIKGIQFWLDAGDIDADPATANPPVGSPVEAWRDKVAGITIRQEVKDRQPKLVAIARDSQENVAGVCFDNDFLTGPSGGAPFTDSQEGALVIVYTARHAHEGYGFEVGGDGVFISTFINPKASGREDFDRLASDVDNRLISPEERRRLKWLSERERLLKEQLKRLDPVAMSLRHSFGPPYEPGVPTSRVMIRGEYDNLGQVVEPGFLSCISGHQEPAKIRLDPFKRWPTRSRRMALAKWIADKDNPLTARVMANRLWHWHFGRGIVETPSDFGQLSGGPSHPELLDWLARQFVEKKWSIKAMHRLIVNSATYRQTSLHLNEQAGDKDPDNKLLWRFPRRRLDAETIRDAILSVSGRLSPEQFGLPIFPPLPDDIEQRVKYSQSKWNTQFGSEGRKRSIYIYQQRTLTMPLLQTFDALVCDESRPRRRHSVTPLQALAMANGEFVNEESKHFADRLIREAGDDVADQVALAVAIAFARPPTRQELALLKSVANADDGGLVAVCRVLLNSNEFIYVD